MVFLKSLGKVILSAAVAGLVAFGGSGAGKMSGRTGGTISESWPEAAFSGPVRPKVMGCPLTNGWIRKSFASTKSLCGLRRGFDIFGPDSVVASACDGIVQATFTVGDIKAVMIRKGRLFYTYSNLDTVYFKKGDTVTEGAILGLSQTKNVEFAVSDDKGRFHDNLGLKVNCKCLVVDYQLSPSADTSLEARALGKVYRLKEVQNKDRWIDSISGHRDRISLMIARRPTVAAPYFWIQAGYDHGKGRFEPYYDFYVSVKGLYIQVPVSVEGDSTLSGPAGQTF